MLAKVRDTVRNYTHFFRNKDEERVIAAGKRAREIVEWISQDYHKRFLKWLDDEASKPMDVTAPQIDLVQAAVRANTFKEVRQHLSKLELGAVAAVRQMEGKDDERD